MKQWNGFDRDDVMTMLRAKAAEKGSQLAVANEIGISQSWLCDILKGRREPVGKVLTYLGLSSMQVYLPRRKPLDSLRGGA